jgi:hypothetical protein
VFILEARLNLNRANGEGFVVGKGVFAFIVGKTVLILVVREAI